MHGRLVSHIVDVARTEGKRRTRVHLSPREGHATGLVTPRNGLDQRAADDMERTSRAAMVVQFCSTPAWPRDEPSIEVTVLGDQPPGPVADARGTGPVHGCAETPCDFRGIDVPTNRENAIAGALTEPGEPATGKKARAVHPEKGND